MVALLSAKAKDRNWQKLCIFAARTGSHSSMDRISDSGSDDLGSNPGGITRNQTRQVSKTCRVFVFLPSSTIATYRNSYIRRQNKSPQIESVLSVYLEVVVFSRLNEQVRRNQDRFPEDFYFQLNKEEWQFLISQNAITRWGGRRKLPFVFTERRFFFLIKSLKLSLSVTNS